MKRVVQAAEGGFEWIDVVEPSAAELNALAAEHGFHRMAVEDCLDPWHLPKYERFDDTTFIILRAIDPAAGPLAASVQELTRKVAVFVRPRLVVTVHRVPMSVVAQVEQRFGKEAAASPVTVLGALVNEALDSYGAPLEKAEDELVGYEEAVFTARRRPPPIVDLYVLKRRVNILRRLIWQTASIVHHLAPPGERTEPMYNDLRENAESYHFYAEHLLDAINSLLAIHVQLASQRTNDVMRVLTVFSAFFLPLTFIVGIWGMNFDSMPELRERWGYPAALVLMAGVALAVGWWFRRRGWLGRGDEP
jgi:magnesium transporter